MPWRETIEPYKIWLSEIILQQTRVEQGLPYWERFVSTYPTVSDLAVAEEKGVLKLWEGLGYYSRARNLHTAAKYIHYELGGVFPKTYTEILKLKGVGPYTAAAIASICYKERTPVVDGNVYRFAARYFGIKEDISKSGTRKIFEKHLLQFIDRQEPDTFNQAMMEFGARVCTPKTDCGSCLFALNCFARKNDLVKNLPIKSKAIKIIDRHLNYIVLSSKRNVLMKERGSKDVWEGLYDFYLIERKLGEEEVFGILKSRGAKFTVIDISEEYKHILSHQKLFARFYHMEMEEDELKDFANKSGLMIFKKEEILNLPKPKLIVNYLNKHDL